MLCCSLVYCGQVVYVFSSSVAVRIEWIIEITCCEAMLWALTDVAAIPNTINIYLFPETFYINFRINKSVNNLARTSRRRINKIMSRSPGQALLSKPYDRRREWEKNANAVKRPLKYKMCQRHETWLRLLWNIMMALSSCHALFYLSLLGN